MSRPSGKVSFMPVHPSNKINVVDLFAGCGGFTQGFREFRPEGHDSSPFRTVGAVEWDIAAATTYAANFSSEIPAGTSGVYACDIHDWNPGDLGDEVDVILGGPPCQGFSGLGKEDPEDPRNRLWREYIRVVQKLEPKVFVIENVDRFLKKPEFAQLQKEVDGGTLKNYELEYGHLISADYGSPQKRKRAIVMVTRRDLKERHPQGFRLQHPRPSHIDQRESGAGADLWTETERKPWVPASSIFGTPGNHLTPLVTDTTELPEGTCELLGKKMPGSFRTSQLHIGRNPTEESLARYMDIPPGGNRHNIRPEYSTESWMRHKSGSGDVMGRVHLDRPSATIRTEFFKPEKGRYLHPWAHRPITHYEAALLQGFPEDFLWCGSKVQIARQIGNAVPVHLSRAIAAEVYEYLEVTGSLD
jgi:DNA (cytosine-5)-methyltransferase 1